MDNYNVKEGNVIFFYTSFRKLLQQIVEKYNTEAEVSGDPVIRNKPSSYDPVIFPCRVVNRMTLTYQKIPKNDLSEMIVLEYDYLMQALATYVPDYLNIPEFVQYM
mmetsp:Transcript_39438/g.29129  ORF Transcript_39438/g.29129 Transcript_39438/m.29129 type:complete len:106 (-) Transcript_39438:871-1188(-)